MEDDPDFLKMEDGHKYLFKLKLTLFGYDIIVNSQKKMQSLPPELLKN